jgi:23S rRNA (adenine2503-C2)-methyltransferase
LDIKSLTQEQLCDWLAAAGHKPYRAEQVRGWLFRQLALSFEEMANIPPMLRMQLAQEFRVQSLQEAGRQASSDGTTKWLFTTHDGLAIETVLIPAGERGTVCVSTQAGCAMGCAFCRTAKMGLKRSLEAGEILEQIIRVMKAGGDVAHREVTNIVFMGMGEPLNNLDAVDLACRTLHDQKAFGLGRGRLTVSTSGVVPRILELVERGTPCQLALSLNGASDAVRGSIMPVNKTWPLAKLMEAIDAYLAATGEWVTLEYILIKDLTCTPQAARDLVKLVKPRRCKVNAIVLNASENTDLAPPSEAEVEAFLDAVRAHHIQIHIRSPRGRDIQAACGQLATQATQADTINATPAATPLAEQRED